MTDPTYGAAFVPHGLFTVPGASDGPLNGLTFAAKDLYDVEGRTTGAGNPSWLETHTPAKKTASAVQRCLDAGADLAGKTLTDELAFSLIGANAHYGTPPNPAAPLRVPGGSSSGSASAVAQGLVDFALGTDTGGSIRIPASFCGLYGMRPTQDRIPMDGVVPLADRLDTVGWFTRDIDTQIAVGAVLLGDDTAPLGDQLLVATDAFALAEPAINAALAPWVEKASALFVNRTTAPVSAMPLAHWRTLFRILQAADVQRAHAQWLAEAKPTFGPGVIDRFDYAASITADEARHADTSRKALIAPLVESVNSGMVICLPTSPCPAPLRSTPDAQLDSVRNRIIELTALAGLAGLPQVTLPVATADDAPIGLSFIGAAGTDQALLALAKKLADQI